jgi:hypothetical protein
MTTTTKDCKQVEHLIGPVTLDILEHANGTRVVLLGDQHELKDHCPEGAKCGMPVFFYLERLFDEWHGPGQLDFFLELDYGVLPRYTGQLAQVAIGIPRFQQLIKQGDIVQNYMGSIATYFWHCFRRLKTECQYYGKPIRFHYADVRRGVLHSGTEKEERAFIAQIQFQQSRIRTIGKKHIEPYLRLLQKLQARDVNFFFRYGKIDKQLKHIKDKHIHKMLNQYLVDYIDENKRFIHDLIYQAVSLLAALKTRPGMYNIATVRQFQVLVLGIALAPLFDIYTLARMFRHNMRRMIVYAGAAHTNRMALFFLQQLNFKSITHEESMSKKSFQCIPMKHVPQPWFT